MGLGGGRGNGWRCWRTKRGRARRSLRRFNKWRYIQPSGPSPVQDIKYIGSPSLQNPGRQLDQKPSSGSLRVLASSKAMPTYNTITTVGGPSYDILASFIWHVSCISHIPIIPPKLPNPTFLATFHSTSFPIPTLVSILIPTRNPFPILDQRSQLHR